MKSGAFIVSRTYEEPKKDERIVLLEMNISIVMNDLDCLKSLAFDVRFSLPCN
jgi:hypothetical protein